MSPLAGRPPQSPTVHPSALAGSSTRAPGDRPPEHESVFTVSAAAPEWLGPRVAASSRSAATRLHACACACARPVPRSETPDSRTTRLSVAHPPYLR